MRKIFPNKTSPKDFHQFMLGAITPRPIAFVSTMDENGINNIAPFSYFNAISSNPPILVFSVNRKSDGSKKDTLLNIEQTKECVVNMVDMEIVRQMVLTSSPFDRNTDEFMKSGLSPIQSTTTKVSGVKESKINFECKLDRIIEFGVHPGASSLIICNVNCINIDENIIDDNNRIDPTKLNAVGRLGRAFYTKINKENIFSVSPNKAKSPIGFENLPNSIIMSKILTGNEIVQIAGLENIPNIEHVQERYDNFNDKSIEIEYIHELAKIEINNGNIEKAFELLMICEYFL